MLKPYKKAEIQFREIKEIGHDGKNSQVFLVHDTQLDAEIVIKKIDKGKVTDPSCFFEESKKLYMSRHTNVVEIHYACEDKDFIYIAMPFYKNGSIKQLIDSKFLTVREIINYSIQFLQGLHNIHSKKLVHFDVKPDNILLCDSGEAVISDFGQAKLTNSIGIAGHDRLYIKQRPPEAFDTDHFDLKYDIFQVGVTLYRMCNGNEVFYEQFKRYTDPACTVITDRDAFKFDVKNERFPNRDLFLPHIPNKLRIIIKKCLAKDPDNRYRNCLELSNDLASIEDALDWQYYQNTTNNVIEWVSDRDDKIITLRKDNSGYSAIKKIKLTGNVQKIRSYCKRSLTGSELSRFFKEV